MIYLSRLRAAFHPPNLLAGQPTVRQHGDRRITTAIAVARPRLLLTHTKGSVALMTGIMLPALVMSLAMGIEVTSWSVAEQHLQQIADISAWAGAARYAASPDAQGATKSAIDLAEINGIVGAQPAHGTRQI